MTRKAETPTVLTSKARNVVVIGTGAAGLAASIDLARAGYAVTALDTHHAPGGKMRHVQAGGIGIDAGPTVFTMGWVFERLFADAGANFGERVRLSRASLLARHAWLDGTRLDLHADINASAEAIAQFSSPHNANGYRRFCIDSADIYATLKDTYIDASRPSMVGLVNRVGWRNLPAMWRTRPFSTLWQALGTYFDDPRLLQLFGRYATYCGSSPFAAPATLMLVAHVEQAGVWCAADGMHALAQSMAALATEHGAQFRYGTRAIELLFEGERVTGVRLASGETVAADHVVFNGDASALARGLLGDGVNKTNKAVPRAERSLSAITWCVKGAARGFPLVHHNVFFGQDYRHEFDAIFRDRRISETPTVYICAQDRSTETAAFGAACDTDPARAATLEAHDTERLLVLINAPADGDCAPLQDDEIEAIKARTWQMLQRCGLHIDSSSDNTVTTSPAQFESLFPASGGALYGRANHGALGSFARPGATSGVQGLYLAGGSVHPGPGVPMATLSGRIAARQLMSDDRRAR